MARRESPMMRGLFLFIFFFLFSGAVFAQETSGGFLQGSIQIGNDTRACIVGLVGAMRYTGFEDITTGLVGHWKLDETSGALVDSAGANDGTAQNTPTYNVTGKIDAGMQFDGISNEHVLVTDPADGSLDFGLTSFSYGGWFYPTAYPEAFSLPFHKGGSSAAIKGYDMEFSRPASNDLAGACLADGSILVCPNFTTSAPALNTWHHFFVTVDRTSNLVKTYHNGVFHESSDISSLGDISSANNLQLGIGDGGSWDYQGKIDEVRIYSRVLTIEEINALPGLTTDITSNLVGHWKFDESAGTTALDSAGTNQEGVLTNSPTWSSSGGKIDGGLVFAGPGTNDYVLFGPEDRAALSMIGDMTVAAWVKTNVNSASRNRIFWEIDGWQNMNYEFAMVDGHLVFEHGDGTGTNDSQNGITVFSDNQWHHVAFVSDYPNGHFYVDGALDKTVTMGFDITNVDTAQNYHISGNGSTSSSHFTGTLDDVRLYSRALTAGDINALPGVGGVVQICDGTNWTDWGN